jgi:DNA helicase-2/ATP-dependent DNA helicase PcrA
VLSRSSKALTELEVMLNARRIRYKKYGGQAIADAAEVKDFISFLRISHNMQDKIALLRALMQFPGIGEGTAAKVIASHEGDLFGADHWPEEARDLPIWVEEIQKLPGLHAKGNLLQEKMKPLILANYPKDGEERLATVHALVQSMESLPGSLVDFLDGFVLNRSANDYHPEEAVVLSTIHSAKGLEWDGVWLIGSGSLQMPHPRSMEAGDIEEERRLFYVAVTRARRQLILSFPGTTEKGQTQRPCPFIPPDINWQFVFGN